MECKEWDRLADGYDAEVISPFDKDVTNPLFAEIKKIKNRKQLSVAEFGCGLFRLAEFLSKEFKSVHASDFSEKMVTKAKLNAKSYSNVRVKKEDVRHLPYKQKFDVIISINSLIMPSYKDILKSFSSLHQALKKNGTIFMILPSLEAVHYHGTLLIHEELKSKAEKKAITSAKRKFEHGKYDFFLGHYTDDEDKQKFYYRHEIEYYLRKSGFKEVFIQRVVYPWGKTSGDYEDFPEEEPMWDWFVKARKS